MNWLIGILVAIVIIFVQTYWKILRGIFSLLILMVETNLHMFRYAKKKYSYADFVESQIDKSPDSVKFIMAETGEKRTSKEVDTLANQIAYWAIDKGCKQGNTAALMLLNNVDYFSIWYGLSKIGVSTALLNTNIMGKAFLHSVETSLSTSETKILIVDLALKEQVAAEISELQSRGIQVYFWGEKQLTEEISSKSVDRPDKSLRGQVMENDALIFIFTSGTTGLPKACKISHSRYTIGALIYPVLARMSSKDILYSAMPLYHSAAGLMAVGGAIRAECTLVIRKKFSASNFTKDCVQYGVTVIQYIGELCRYLVNLAPNPLDQQLSIRVAFGNGMRKEYWEKFQERYKVKNIIEFYAATEGNIGLFNCFEKVGPLGYIPRFLDFIYPLKIVKTDPHDQSVPYRNSKGFCELCELNEPGLLLGEITTSRRFEGYTDKKATNAKILKDVFRKGDSYFNTGDLLSRDAEGYYYWSDRIGDTFRWKGENVSTTEVSEVISECHCVDDVVVYGVSVPNTDGKPGMAAIVGKDNALDLSEIEAECAKHLPVYARPLFLRLKSDGKLPTTSTHKYVKHDLVNEGFNPSKVGNDQLYMLDAKSGKYILLTADTFAQIENGSLRL